MQDSTLPLTLLQSHAHTHIHIENNIPCRCLYKIPATPPAPNPNPPGASQGGETQTRVQRALSTPQPLNTFSALPFENKPRRQAPRLTLSPHVWAHMPHARLGALRSLSRRCSRKQMWERHDASLGNVEIHYFHDEGELGCGTSSAVGQSWLRWHSAELNDISSVLY